MRWLNILLPDGWIRLGLLCLKVRNSGSILSQLFSGLILWSSIFIFIIQINITRININIHHLASCCFCFYNSWILFTTFWIPGLYDSKLCSKIYFYLTLSASSLSFKQNLYMSLLIVKIYCPSAMKGIAKGIILVRAELGLKV